jgi:RNA polymerase sigma-70 factor (ECF subfamily)
VARRPPSVRSTAQPSSRGADPPSGGPERAVATPTGSLESWTDEELFAQVRRGSERHFNALYERYFRRIYHFIYVRLRNHADAEELTQETFTVVFRSAGAFSGRASPLAWIYGIARNTVNNHHRRARLQGQRLEEAGPEALTADSAEWRGTPEDHLTLDRILRAMERRLSMLSPWQTEVFLLRHVDNASIREICRRTARSSDAVRSGLYRAKRELLEATGQPVDHGHTG